MPDIDNLGLLTIKYETVGRQLPAEDNTNNRKRNCQCNRVVHIQVGMSESCTNRRQDAETQSQHNADNTTEPSVFTNPMVIGNNNTENSFPSESTKILIVSFQS